MFWDMRLEISLPITTIEVVKNTNRSAMPMRWIRSGILFACVFELLGCASSAPDPRTEIPNDEPRATMDSVQRASDRTTM